MTEKIIALQEHQRLAAHKIIYQGSAYINHYAFMDTDGTVSLRPMTAEIHSTVFINGTVGLLADDRRLCYYHVD